MVQNSHAVVLSRNSPGHAKQKAIQLATQNVYRRAMLSELHTEDAGCSSAGHYVLHALAASAGDRHHSCVLPWSQARLLQSWGQTPLFVLWGGNSKCLHCLQECETPQLKWINRSNDSDSKITSYLILTDFSSTHQLQRGTGVEALVVRLNRYPSNRCSHDTLPANIGELKMVVINQRECNSELWNWSGNSRAASY